MKKNKQKGFTLVELIIVIAIIGVLAGVLIPTFAGVIEKAKIANDQASLKNFNTVLSIEATLRDTSYFEDWEVVEILSREGYTEIKATSKEMRFWYNRETNAMEYLTDAAAGVGATASLTAFADGEQVFTQNRVAAVSKARPELLYMDQNASPLRTAIDTINYLVRDAKKALKAEENDSPTEAQMVTKMNALFAANVGDGGKSVSGVVADVQTHLGSFNPLYSLYISEEGFYTGVKYAGNTTDSSITSVTVEKTVFTPGIKTIPECKMQATIVINDVLEIPSSVTKIEAGAFTSLDQDTVVQAKNNSLFNTTNINPLCTISNTFVGKVNVLIPTVTYTGQKEARYQGYVTLANGKNHAISLYERMGITYTQKDTGSVDTDGNKIYAVEYTLGTYSKAGKEGAPILSEYLIPTFGISEENNANFKFKDLAQVSGTETLLEALQKLGTVRLATKDYGTVVVMTGALAMEDGTVWRIQPIGYIKQITTGIVSSMDGYIITVYDPTCGVALDNMQGITVKAKIEDNDTPITLTYDATQKTYVSEKYTERPTVEYYSIIVDGREVFRQGASLA